MKTRYLLLVCSLTCISSIGQGKTPHPTAGYLSAAISRQQEMSNLIHWVLDDAHAHSQAPDQTRLQLHIPSVDIFAPDGSLVYHAPDADSAVRVLEALPALPAVTTGPVTLDEALDIIPEFKLQKDAIKKRKKFIVYAITDSAGGCKHCAAQDAEIAQLRTKPGLSNYSILQVTLTK